MHSSRYREADLARLERRVRGLIEAVGGLEAQLGRVEAQLGFHVKNGQS